MSEYCPVFRGLRLVPLLDFDHHALSEYCPVFRGLRLVVLADPSGIVEPSEYCPVFRGLRLQATLDLSWSGQV